MAYPIKAICEGKDVRADGTSIIYLQFYARDGKRKLNTGLYIPPECWNQKQRIVTEKLPPAYGMHSVLNSEITRLLRLAEDLIEYGEQQKKEPIGEWVKKNFRPDLNLENLKLGITSNAAASTKPGLRRCCYASSTPPQIIPHKAIITPPKEKSSHDDGMIFPNLPPDSRKNGAPWPNVFDQIDLYIRDKAGDVSRKTLQVYKNMGDQLRQYQQQLGYPITFLSFNFEFYNEFKKFLTFDYVHMHRKGLIKGLKRNSISKTIKNLRFFVKDRVRRFIIPPIDMSDFKAPEEETDAIYLNFEEIAQIYYCDLSTHPHLVNDQKLFVLACLNLVKSTNLSRWKWTRRRIRKAMRQLLMVC